MKCQMLVRTFNAHTHEQDDASIYLPIPTAICARQCLQKSALANAYSNLRSPMPTAICARQCLQQSALANAYSNLRSPMPTEICARQCLQQSALANAYRNLRSPMPTAICARQCLQQPVLANAYNNLCSQGPASYNHTQLMRPGFGRNVSCAMATFVSHLGLSFSGKRCSLVLYGQSLFLSASAGVVVWTFRGSSLLLSEHHLIKSGISLVQILTS